jgi:hypothetical protein
MTMRGEKLGGHPQISQSVFCELGWGPFFSGAVDPFNSVDDYVKGCHTWTEHGMCMTC